MQQQLRVYTIKHGEMGEWVAEWRRSIVPLRRKHGFDVVQAWTAEADDKFIWIMRYGGPSSWKEADAAYYASPERKAIQPDPARHIVKPEHWMMEPIDLS